MSDQDKTVAAIDRNTKILLGCVGPHSFRVVDVDPSLPGGVMLECSLCGGQLDAISALWYQRGLAHGRDEAQEIVMPSRTKTDSEKLRAYQAAIATCSRAFEETNGIFRCTRHSGHEGPCAAVPVGQE
jgi:hypothetical protein